ncbi:hypothetical protein AHAS_Ahas09G0057400 [Arachis hypogaea]
MIWGLQGAWLQLYVRRVEGLDKGMIVLTCQNNLWSVSGYFGVYLADVEGFEADEVFKVVGEGAEAVEAVVKDLERGEVFNEVSGDIQDLKLIEAANGVR